MVHVMTTKILIDKVLVRLQKTTGMISRSVIKNNSSTFAVRLTHGPVYIKPFGSDEGL